MNHNKNSVKMKIVSHVVINNGEKRKMNFEYLNEMTRYIEEYLTEEISYKELSRIVGVSEYFRTKFLQQLKSLRLYVISSEFIVINARWIMERIAGDMKLI